MTPTGTNSFGALHGDWTSFYSRSSVINLHHQQSVLNFVANLTYRVYMPWFDRVSISDEVRRLAMHLIFDTFNYKDTKRVRLSTDQVLGGRIFIDVRRDIEVVSLTHEVIDKHFELLDLFDGYCRRKKLFLDFEWLRNEFSLANEVLLWLLHSYLKAGISEVPIGSLVPENLETASFRQHLAKRA